MYFKLFVLLCVLFSQAKSEHAEKLNEAFALIQKAMILLKEVQANVESEELVNPSNYQLGLDAIKDGKHEEARKYLIPFSKSNGQKAVHSLFWIGYSFMHENNWDKAIFAFTAFLNRLDELELIGISAEMKKQANKHLVKCFEKIRRPADAIAVLKRMEMEYPNESEYVRIELARLKA